MPVFLFGGAKRIRTAGLLVANEALYQLSHIPENITYYILFFLLCQRFFACFSKKNVNKPAFFIRVFYNKNTRRKNGEN